MTTQTEIQPQVISLSAEAFETFCEDISGMFCIDMQCSQQESCTETVKGLKKRFKKLAAVNSIKAEGALNGNFQIIFDKDGLFILAGVIVMLPEQKILENSRLASVKAAEEMADAVKEAGNMLVGSWDRVFREELEGHKHFVQTNMFIGDPWDNPEENIGLAGDEEFLFVPFEMTIGSYRAFNCGVIFPKAIFSETSVSDAKTVTPADEKTQEKQQEEAQDQQDTAEKAKSKEPETAEKNDSEESARQAEAEEKTVETADKTAKQPVETEQETSNENQTEAAEQDENTEQVTGPASETIHRTAQSLAGLPGGDGLVSLAMCAKDIMQKDVCWITPEDSVQNALTKMQQVNSGYVLVGTDGVLEGILSKSDIASAVSIYLQPIFAKWRRPIDDATLNIRVKWIMTRPVHTIKPDTSLAAIIEKMSQVGGKCMPVIEQRGKVAGLVTVFDIFKALLNSASDASVVGESLQVPSLP